MCVLASTIAHRPSFCRAAEKRMHCLKCRGTGQDLSSKGLSAKCTRPHEDSPVITTHCSLSTTRRTSNLQVFRLTEDLVRRRHCVDDSWRAMAPVHQLVFTSILVQMPSRRRPISCGRQESFNKSEKTPHHFSVEYSTASPPLPSRRLAPDHHICSILSEICTG